MSQEGAMATQDTHGVELLLLREFFDCWKTFHATPKDSIYRTRLERAAQRMEDAANSVKRFQESMDDLTARVQEDEGPLESIY